MSQKMSLGVIEKENNLRCFWLRKHHVLYLGQNILWSDRAVPANGFKKYFSFMFGKLVLILWHWS